MGTSTHIDTAKVFMVGWNPMNMNTKSGKGVCSLPSCAGEVVALGYCRHHYYKHRYYGSAENAGSGRFISKGDTFEERFWQRVDKSPGLGPQGDCWEWRAGRFTDKGKLSYGCVTYNDRAQQAHRVSWFLHTGIWPEQNVLHSCNNVLCCNPKHLREGTQKANMQDKIESGNQMRGEQVNSAKLTEPKVRMILAAIAKGEKLSVIGKAFGVDWQVVSRIKKGITWKHVPRI